MDRAANSRNQAVIRAKLTVLSSLATIQIELTIVMHWKGAGHKWGTGVEMIHSISGSIGFHDQRRNWKMSYDW